MNTRIGSNPFLGNYNAAIRVNGGRTVLGVGHTREEAWRNACDGHAERSPILEGAMAVLRDMPPRERVEPVVAKQSWWRKLLKEIGGQILCLLAMSPVIVAFAVVFGGA